MYDVQRTTSTGNAHNSGSNPLTVNVQVPAGRVPINGQWEVTSGSYSDNRGRLTASYRSASDTWTFKFGDNNSGSTQTYSLHVDHVPALDVVEVLKVA